MSKRFCAVRSLALLLAVASLPLVTPSRARGDDLLLQETEALRNTLTLSDPQRVSLTLRLADLYMDEASRSVTKKVQYQTRALALYDETLKEKIQGSARIKIDFQRARLMADLGHVDRSLPLWKALAMQREMPDISREAALRLAETGDTLNAAKWYQQALELCSGGDLCSYIRFKRAWLYRQSAKGGVADDRAIGEMELALFDAKGQIREESLRDYLVFIGEKLGTDETGARSALSKIESLAQKLDRKQLIGDLAEAYFAAGNKAAGTFVLAQAQRGEPRFIRLARLAEEQYGLRDWDAFSSTLAEISTDRGRALLSAASPADQVEGEKFLRRLVIQLDGERIGQKARTVEFQKASLTYLGLFPNSTEKAKFQEGWLASESDSQKKLDQLAIWIQADPASARLREFRASIAQKAGMHGVVAAEMTALASLPQATGKAREYRYLQARSLYEAKDFAGALPLFESLATVSGGAQPDSWAIQSQNLALDILNQQKNWDGIISRSSAWLDAGWAKGAGTSQLRKELADMAEVRTQAKFQKAVALGETPAALAQFMEFCRNGVLVDKSCENARVLSIKRKEQETLIAVLEKMGPAHQSELAQELEASGYFARAAKLHEQMGASSRTRDATGSLKLALLWELSGDQSAFVRSVSSIRDGKVSLDDKQEALWLSMAMDIAEKDASLFSPQTLKFLRTDASRERVAEWIESRGKGSPETRKILLSAKYQSGPAWRQLILSEIDSGLKTAQGISFYGRNSKSQFEKRLAAMVRVAKRADEFFPKCDPQTKSALATMLKLSYEGLANEIRQSPIPAGVPEEALPELKAGLEEMAKPFDEKAAVYAQVILAPSPVMAEGTTSDRISVSSAHAEVDTAIRARIDQFLQELHRNPESAQALEVLRDSYRSIGRVRLSGYFEGRLNAAGGRK